MVAPEQPSASSATDEAGRRALDGHRRQGRARTQRPMAAPILPLRLAEVGAAVGIALAGGHGVAERGDHVAHDVDVLRSVAARRQPVPALGRPGRRRTGRSQRGRRGPGASCRQGEPGRPPRGAAGVAGQGQAQPHAALGRLGRRRRAPVICASAPLTERPGTASHVSPARAGAAPSRQSARDERGEDRCRPGVWVRGHCAWGVRDRACNSGAPGESSDVVREIHRAKACQVRGQRVNSIVVQAGRKPSRA